MKNNLISPYHTIWFEKINSTNSFLKDKQDLFQNKTVISTLNQTNGRGTKQRKFHAIPNKTLCFSILLKNIKPSFLTTIPILSAICFIKTLKHFSVKTATIKWFNDITIENKKIAGILCESNILKKTANIIVGIGVNLLSKEEELKNLGLLNATSIFSKTNKKINPKDFLEKYLIIFDRYILNYSRTKIIAKYEKYCYTIGKNLKIFNLKNGDIFFAKAKNLLLDGSLLVESKKNFFNLNYNDFSIQEI